MTKKQKKTKNDYYYTGKDSFSPIPLNVASPPIKGIDKNKLKATALEKMELNAQEQINLLRSQAELIMQQAKAIEERIEISRKIYLSKFKFEPVIGQTYHLYENKASEWILSKISPNEWGNKCPYQFINSVKLLGDNTWALTS